MDLSLLGKIVGSVQLTVLQLFTHIISNKRRTGNIINILSLVYFMVLVCHLCYEPFYTQDEIGIDKTFSTFEGWMPQLSLIKQRRTK